MTTKPKTKPKATRKNEFEKAAAIDFEAWQEDKAITKQLPTLDDVGPHLMMVRLAYALMHKSKTQLAEVWESAGPTLNLNINETLEDSRKFFEGAAHLIDDAQKRLLIAGAVVFQEPDKRGRRQALPS
jgi:hypothetical protein